MEKDLIVRVRFEKGEISLNIFEKNNPIPIASVRGNLKDKNVRSKIALIKKEFGSLLFSDIVDFMDINYNLKEEFDLISKLNYEE